MIATIFDTETTTLVTNHVVKLDRQPHVIELYACHVDLNNGHVFDDLDLLVRPPEERDLDLEVAKKSHGLTWDDLKDKPRFREVADRVMTFLSRGDAVVAHNLSFDMEMIDLEVERLGKAMFWPPRKICTVEQTTWVRGTWLKLEDLHDYLFSAKFSGAHRARTDVEALTRCCVEMRRRDWI